MRAVDLNIHFEVYIEAFRVHTFKYTVEPFGNLRAYLNM